MATPNSSPNRFINKLLDDIRQYEKERTLAVELYGDPRHQKVMAADKRLRDANKRLTNFISNLRR